MTAATLAGLLLAHLVGDYLLQSHWMATEKVRRWWPAIAHAVTYGLPFLLVTQSPAALLVIVGTHAVIDRYRLARHVVWAKNHLAPRAAWPGSFRKPRCSADTGTPTISEQTGYPDNTPPWLAVWLMIIADNTLHLLINVAAVVWL
ncbi:DUF3307 domain-containing protein [Williamsia herbipolensis]|uniref:DUF3307 domain-containing protein n=1 Tax=Williamsia herbipolensis TaxID=1603258 RepID=A0AAU4K057_9NOCA|nr:DUF3307 domain-containing protein [Williamsia herbipolensis]